MKKRVLLVISILLILSGIFILIRIASSTFAPQGRGALQVTSNIKAEVFVDNKPIGTTPLCRCNEGEFINSGTHDLRIVPEDKTQEPFIAKVDINSGVLTAVERTFLPGSLASYYILTLEKANSGDAEVFISSIPDSALVFIDGESKGTTPYETTLSASEHEVEIEKPGFSKKTVRIRTVTSYKLILNVALGVEGGEDVQITPLESDNNSSPSAAPSPTPIENSIKVLDTPTGFLRVRSEPSTGASEVSQVTPGAIFEYIDENTSWYKIKLGDGEEGWISKTYAEPVTSN